jgi:hypothetical protein
MLPGSRVGDLFNSLELLDFIRHARDDELFAEESPLAARAIAHGVREILVVPFVICLLDGREVSSVPVEAHETADEQLATQAVFA